MFHTYSDCSNPLSKVTPIVIIRENLRIYLPFFLEFLATIAVALAICGEPLWLFSGTPGSPDAIYVRILVPFAARFMFKSKLCLSAVIWAFALEAITLCRCIRLVRFFRIRAWSRTGTARRARVTMLASQAVFYFTNYVRIIYKSIAS